MKYVNSCRHENDRMKYMIKEEGVMYGYVIFNFSANMLQNHLTLLDV